ncbi:uncharacterized protein LOC144434916 [Glandiceps talaboti]
MVLRLSLRPRRIRTRSFLTAVTITCIVFVFLMRFKHEISLISFMIKRWQNGPCKDKGLTDMSPRELEVEGVYIDVGAGNGQSLIAFYDPLLAQDFNVLLPCQYDPKRWKVYVFEADLRFDSILYEMKRKYGFTLYSSTAAWHNDEPLSINLEKVKRTLNFSKWLRYNVIKDDFVVMRMNIGGAEYEVLDKLLKDGTFCLVDVLVVYYHQNEIGRSVIADTDIPHRIRTIAKRTACNVRLLYEGT